MNNNTILFIIDEIELKYFEFNKLVTNFWLIAELLKRNYRVFVASKNMLYLNGNKACALCYESCYKNNDIFKNDEKLNCEINSFAAVFFRPDPPVDIDYINATYILSYVDKNTTLCINSAQAIRDFNEKLYINNFEQLAPKNIVTSDPLLIKEFLFDNGEIIIKPLNRCFSSGVFYLNTEDKNINTIIQTATNSSKTTVMVQKFLPQISKGDKRLIFICGKIYDYCVTKAASNNDFKFNQHTDANLKKGILSEEEKQIEKIISQKLLSDGIYMAGLDVIDGKIIEINITSPCFFIKEINHIYNINFEKIITDELEDLICTRVAGHKEREFLKC